MSDASNHRGMFGEDDVRSRLPPPVRPSAGQDRRTGFALRFDWAAADHFDVADTRPRAKDDRAH